HQQREKRIRRIGRMQRAPGSSHSSNSCQVCSTLAWSRCVGGTDATQITRPYFGVHHGMFRMRFAILSLALPSLLSAQRADWPVYGGNTDNTHYSTLSQITPANVGQLKVAWTYETKDEFKGSEMQANPIVIDGVLYATTPKMRVFALDATTGRELWSF